VNTQSDPRRNRSQRRQARRGRASRLTLGILAGVGLPAALLTGAWLGGCFPAHSRNADRENAARQPPAAELKTELATLAGPAAEFGEPSLATSLAAVAAAAGVKGHALDDPAWLARLASRNDWGDRRKADEEGANRASSWELRFGKGVTKEKYAHELDYFGIELAVVLPDNKLICVSKFSKPKPEIRDAAADAERRCYLTWREGDLSRADNELLARAEVSTSERIVLKIIPLAVAAKLAELEKASAGDQLDDVRKTQFGIRDAGDGYEFYVIDQYRRERVKK
jgi:hypothetical protein